ncbi:MAG: DUF4070 domain-containing protein [Candidatus Staskawiczbacteria bacterium]|nr:DUF4070 domain-containing protein [Candidatus Staskawiczbacteria bacterium]
MRVLLVYPEFKVTFWGWKYLLRIIGKRAAFPPLGLLTVAAMLPESWEKKLVDLNVCKLTDEDIRWANYVFVGAMITQNDSTQEVLKRCERMEIPVVMGGPILEKGCEEFPSVRHFLLGEVENIMPQFLNDLALYRAKKVYLSPPNTFPDMSASPIPLWGLINPRYYASMLVQFVRGCPYKCEFCAVANLNGRTPRAKLPKQFLRELDALYKTGFRGGIMVADDNFIGNKAKVKAMLLRLVGWQITHKYPYEFTVEADITLADDEDLMDLMVKAGFKKVFLGLETPNKESLIECGKTQNVNRDMCADVKKIHNHGLVTLSGFIFGFDHDGPDIFKQHIEFYRKTGIIFPMLSMLQASKGSLLYKKMEEEGRLQEQASGNNTDCRPNFACKMPVGTLVQGYKDVLKTVYSPREYYERIRVFLREYNTTKKVARKVTASDVSLFFSSVWRIGIFGGFRTSFYYWRTLSLAFFKHRRAFSEAVTFWVYRLHFWRFAKNNNS